MRVGLKRLLLAASLAALVNLGSAGSAQASVSLTLHEAGFTDVTVNNGTNFVVFAGTFGNFTLSLDTGISAVSANDARLSTTTNSTRDTVGGAKTLTITVSDNFAQPNAPSTLTSNLSSTLISGGSVSFQSFLNATSTTKVTLTTAPGTASSPPVSVLGTSAPFTLSNVTTITLGALGSANSTGTTDALAAVPEPASIVALLSAVPIIGIGAMMRRRKAQA